MFLITKDKRSKRAYAQVLFSFVVLALTMSPVIQAASPKAIIGKFKVIKASCGGESFLWKKQDKVISVGGVLFVKGNDLEDNCRFEDRYRKEKVEVVSKDNSLEENYELKAVGRKVYCFNQEGVAGGVLVKNVPMVEPLSQVTLKRENGNISLKMSEFELCDGEVELELAHDRY